MFFASYARLCTLLFHAVLELSIAELIDIIVIYVILQIIMYSANVSADLTLQPLFLTCCRPI